VTPSDELLARLTRTSGALTEAIRGHSEASLSLRPDERSWYTTEVVCHLRHVEDDG
jgi:hypothetical protein